MDKILQRLGEINRDKASCVLCTVVHSQGSTPRKPGAKMIVYPDKKTEGTIGGGAVEQQAIEDAIDQLKHAVPKLVKYNLEQDLNMKCGGKVEVFIDPIVPGIKLFIFGAGHIGKELAHLALNFGFQITLFDERKNIDVSQLPEGCNIMLKDYKEAADQADFDDTTCIVTVTPQHDKDVEILELTAHKPHIYLGMIGSKRKVAEVRKIFTENNKLTTEELDAIDMPIGLDIKAETPAEIALSILAKLITVKNSLN